MPSSKKDYKKLYQLQDSVFAALAGSYGQLYLTGGTALDRFFLHHRYSDDIDLFANNDPTFKETAGRVRRILAARFQSDPDDLILHDDFIRMWIIEDDLALKVEMVNDVAARWGQPMRAGKLAVDNPGNILANKLTAVVSRDEPKDVFDIIMLAKHYYFNWAEVFNYSVQKAIVSEQDVAIRLGDFPIASLTNVTWIKEKPDINTLAKEIETISNDFLFARDNSLGKGRMSITEAEVVWDA